MSAMGKIGDRYIEEAAAPEKIVQRKVVKNSWTKTARMCASVAIIIAASFLLNFLYHMSGKNQLVLTAYAVDKNGQLSYEKVSDEIHVPVSVSEGQDGTKKFLFSMELPNGVVNQAVTITTVSGEEESNNNCIFDGFPSDSGKIYFYIESSEDEFPQDVTISYTDANSNSNELTLRISENNGKYDCILMKLTQDLGK